MRIIVALVLSGCLAPALLAADGNKRIWTFDGDVTGGPAKGFTAEVGAWTVAEVPGGKALAQTAKNASATFNIALADDTHAKDVDLSVAMRAIAGKVDQGGGLVWRATDAKNYYIARYNPLEDNYRVYKVVDGKRTQLQNADIPHSAGEHTLRVTMHGDHIECHYDGKMYLDARDATFTAAGKIGLWTKADAQTNFANLRATEVPTSAQLRRW
jgi:hypothetical protein